ncbi:hypothetical protein C8J57DRAFT_1339062 [Mycena rebaudengoi]|nr:hypothetical protein C8J57DRAFT_1339062 [Mycena rebaudengoi]
MEKAWNKDPKYFGQSYEDNDILDSAMLIMPLVFLYPAQRPLIHRHLEAAYEYSGRLSLRYT